MANPIRVKIVSKNGIRGFQLTDLPQQFPGIEFITDAQCEQYDWLVIYDDLPPAGDERLSLGRETLACPPENTVLLTYEPSSVKFYGNDYTNQFGMVLTSHEAAALGHPNRFDVPPIGFWYYGGLEQMQAHPTVPEKTKNLSIFGSAKQQKHTLHKRRFDFIQELTAGLGDALDVFGKGYHFVEHKAEALDDYRYHIAVENHIGPHHWTEKLSDSFLGYSLPFYAGCSNVADYFPEESFIQLDIRDSEAAIQTIQNAIANHEYEKRLPAIIEARRRVIEDYNLGNMIAKHIAAAPQATDMKPGAQILSRHAMMREGLGVFLRYAIGKGLARRKNRLYFQRYLATTRD
ncbi:glycosyltransferase family 10 [Alphaproteobacteria bacterium]|nr:glycosyltransferase family 10 [Alphaproteobacteria bacterium]MDC0147737.1 glycosyltransferase family 10 [Alphaproteobacteria bacterium]